MGLLKRIELIAKLLLALAGALLLWRPGRRETAGARLGGPRRVLLVRIDDRVGEALLTTPLLASLRALRPPPEVHVLVHSRVARVLEGHPLVSRLIAFDRRRLWLGPLAPGVRALRREAYEVVVSCANWEAPSVTQALVARLSAPRGTVVGPAVWPVGRLADVAVAPAEGTCSELVQRHRLLAPLGIDGPPGALSFRAPKPRAELGPLIEKLRATPHSIVNPGGRLGWRRVPAQAFAAVARALAEAGRPPWVTFGPGEEELAREVVAAAPGATLAPPTSLDDLAALMEAAGLTVCNNTGPMHLSVAVGAPTLAFFLYMPIERWGHAFPPHRMVDLTPFAADLGALSAHAAGEARAFARASLTPRAAAPPR